MRVVIDTNLLFDSVAPKGDKHWVLDSFFDGKFTWIFSNEILSTPNDGGRGRPTKAKNSVTNHFLI